MKQENKRNKFDKHGFMMIEAVFATFIVGVILVTFLAVMGSSYRTEFAKRDLIVATNLAQEGIELVRNIRDNNWKKCSVATNPCPSYRKAFGAPFPSNDSGYCFVYNGDYRSSHPTHGCESTKLRLTSGGFYQYATGTSTKFSRNISIEGDDDSRTITSTVSWSGKRITMEDTLYAWGDAE